MSREINGGAIVAVFCVIAIAVLCFVGGTIQGQAEAQRLSESLPVGWMAEEDINGMLENQTAYYDNIINSLRREIASLKEKEEPDFIVNPAVTDSDYFAWTFIDTVSAPGESLEFYRMASITFEADTSNVVFKIEDREVIRVTPDGRFYANEKLMINDDGRVYEAILKWFEYVNEKL